jgi:hypothetical protein
MIELIDAARNIGAEVAYLPRGASWTTASEHGVITGVTASWVFVRYGADVNAKATHPGDLYSVGDWS